MKIYMFYIFDNNESNAL